MFLLVALVLAAVVLLILGFSVAAVKFLIWVAILVGIVAVIVWFVENSRRRRNTRL